MDIAKSVYLSICQGSKKKLYTLKSERELKLKVFKLNYEIFYLA